MTPPITRGTPLRDEVYVRVVELISAGEYPPGATLTEASLSRALAVSRTPVREALLRLQAEGVLRSTLARGFTVRPLVRRDAEELYPILASLEGLAARMIPAVDDALVNRLRKTLAELRTATDPVRRWQLDSAWHTAIAEASGNEHLAGLLNQLRTNLSRYELAFMREVRARADINRQHEDIQDTLAAGDVDLAADLLEAHWHDGLRQILNWLPD